MDPLPKRDVPALIEALRVRALALKGEAWEWPATRDMMKEAADALEALLASTVPPPSAQDDGVTVWPPPPDRPHGPVSERFMRHHYGAPGYVPPPSADATKDMRVEQNAFVDREIENSMKPRPSADARAKLEQLAEKERARLAETYKLPMNQRGMAIHSAKLDAYEEAIALLALPTHEVETPQGEPLPWTREDVESDWPPSEEGETSQDIYAQTIATLCSQAWCQGVRPSIDAQNEDEFVSKLIAAVRGETPQPAAETLNARQPISDEESRALLQTTDGAKWANAFCRATGFPDEGWALTWFCNAIMAQYDECHRQPAAESGWREGRAAGLAEAIALAESWAEQSRQKRRGKLSYDHEVLQACEAECLALADALKSLPPVVQTRPEEPNMVGCKQCQRDFPDGPDKKTWTVGGIPARTWFFCSEQCLTKWLDCNV